MFKILIVVSLLIIGLTACEGNGRNKDENMTQNEKVLRLIILDELLKDEKQP